MEKFMEARRTFEENWMELETGPGGVELFPGRMVGEKGSVNESILREARLKEIDTKPETTEIDLRSGAEKLADAKIAKAFYIGKKGDPSFMDRLAKKLGADGASLPMFRYMMGEQVKGAAPNFGKYEYREEQYKKDANGEIIEKKWQTCKRRTKKGR